MSSFKLSWRRDREDFDFLQRSKPSHLLKKLCGEYRETPIDPREVSVVENQGQQGSCFPAGAKVTMANGEVKRIEDVEFGDFVVTHTGASRQVIDTMSRLYSGEMTRVFVKGWGYLTMTSDHTVRLLRGGKLVWEAAANIRSTDRMVVSRGPSQVTRSVLDLSDWCDGKLNVDGDELIRGKVAVNRWLKLDDLTCYVIGLYCAEGSTDKTSIGEINRFVFTMHEDEVECHEAIVKFCDRLGVRATIQCRDGSKAVNVRGQSSVLAQFFDKACGRFCNHKKVPHFIVTGTAAQKLAFLRGYYKGDGTDTKLFSGRRAASGSMVSCNQIHAASASRVMSQQVATLLVSIGYKPGRSLTRPRDHQRYCSYQTYIYGEDACNFAGVEYTDKSTGAATKAENRKKNRFCSEGQPRKIREIERYNVTDLEVYDFTVDGDHSFVCQGLVVHNCQGHAISSCVEFCYWIASGGQKTQLSRAMGYYATQWLDGISGDRGSTISGGVKLAMGTGICEESLWPYPSRYSNAKPRNWSEIESNAAKYKVKSRYVIDSYEALRTFLGSGQGAVSIGITWNDYVNRPVVESFRGGSGGGHAIALLGLSPRKNRKNEPYVWMMNSWGSSWGNHGWAEWSPDACRQILADRYTACIGISDMENVRPRDLSAAEITQRLKDLI